MALVQKTPTLIEEMSGQSMMLQLYQKRSVLKEIEGDDLSLNGCGEGRSVMNAR
jgi:hypothetical protein